MYVENANRSIKGGSITVDNLEPISKNPIIASFFRNIGYADQLGSGVRKLFKYSKFYSGKEPEFIEGDVFKIIVPLDDNYSYDVNLVNESAARVPISADKMPISADKNIEDMLSHQQTMIYQYIKEYGKATSQQIAELLEVKPRRVRDILGEMVQMDLVEKQGAYKSTVYVLK